MAHVLIGWELGANRGHLSRMTHFHDALVGAGHRVSFAVQRIDGIAGEHLRTEATVWQAPLWPRLLGWVGGAGGATPATLGDILARLGLGDAGTLSSLVGAWDALLAAARPDMVVAEYAPALLCAARGRVPAVAVGIGFDLPPADMPRFPALGGRTPATDEAALLARVNAELALAGRAPLPALPALFAADRTISVGIDTLDPYAAWRRGGMTPTLTEVPPPAPPEGNELFVYWADRAIPAPRLWEGLRLSGLPVRIHIPRLDDAAADALRGMGFAVEPRPLPFATIARRSRLLLSHGGAGFAGNALLAGRPQVVVHYDLEKEGNGMVLDRLGLGAQMPLGDFDAAAFARGLRALHGDAALAARTLDHAVALRARVTEPAAAAMLRAVAELA